MHHQVRYNLKKHKPTLTLISGKKRNKKTTSVNIPEQHKLIEKIERGEKGCNYKAWEAPNLTSLLFSVETVNLLNKTKKITVSELRKSKESKEKVAKANLKKLRQLREICKIDLDKEITRQIFKRAVTKRPVPPKRKSKKSQKTVFTEEDFQRFEEDYFAE